MWWRVKEVLEKIMEKRSTRKTIKKKKRRNEFSGCVFKYGCNPHADGKNHGGKLCLECILWIESDQEWNSYKEIKKEANYREEWSTVAKWSKEKKNLSCYFRKKKHSL